MTSHSPRRIASANERTTGRDSGRLVVFASSNSAALAGVIVCTLLRTNYPPGSVIGHRLPTQPTTMIALAQTATISTVTETSTTRIVG